jgi:hypothetical protein
MIAHRSRVQIAAIALMTLFAPPARADWKPANGPLLTRWAKDVSPEKALPEYPRPQMVRDKWQNLNGLWQFAAAKEGDQPPVGKDLSEQILVPFPVESALSGVMRHEERMWYRRTFQTPADWKGQHVLLHFGAVDFQADVYVNGKNLGQHKGGYDGFSFDITDALKSDGPQELIVGVYDGTDRGNQPRGKQTARPSGIWYTPTSGIWQTVWMEPVPVNYVRSLYVVPDIDSSNAEVHCDQTGSGEVTVEVFDGDRSVATQKASSSGTISVSIPNPKLWSPENPFLYRLSVKQSGADGKADSITSYFAMRKISLGKDDRGIVRIMLNNKPVFMTGPLDQGFWPDGLYTAPTDEALKYDIEMTKKLGFNMTRKHVKVEPERWYYWCDKLGLLVWQDMPSMRVAPRTDQQKQEFESELDHLIEGRRSHPSIIMWVVFNEGWGQYDTPRIVEHVKKMDPSRLVNNASGWTDQNCGDVIDMHHYPDPAMPKPEEQRAAVLGEFGGLGLALPHHTWTERSWGYRGVGDTEALTTGYERMLAKAWKLRDKGLCAAVYTQITDVETECNGLMTYDREVLKVDEKRAAAVNSGHVENVVIPEPIVLVPSAQQQPAEWRYTTEKPADDWMKPEFNDSTWKTGKGGFGTEGTPSAVVNTTWNTADIWIRREITLPATMKDPSLWLHHDEDAEVYLNGVLAVRRGRFVTEYESVPINAPAKATLKPGKNAIAIHCHQTTGGQYIDAGIIDTK